MIAVTDDKAKELFDDVYTRYPNTMARLANDTPTRAPDGEIGQFYFWLGSDAEVAEADMDDESDGIEEGD